MEFFEKAHCLKLSDDPKKDSKPDEKIKNQLKKMLHGYKKSDNELIRNSDNIDDSESTSVSGFSDLNLSNASSGNDTTRATLDSSDLDSVSNLIASDEDSSIPLSLSLTRDVSEDVLSHSKSEKELSSELNEESDSLFTFASSNISSTNGSKSDSECSSLFDADGALAQKIHKRLNMVKDPHDKLKRKLVEIKESSIIPSEEELLEPKASKKANYEMTRNNTQFAENANIQSNVEKDKLLYTIKPTSNFVSITSGTATTQHFEDIVGHYRNSTMKNISTERYNVTFSSFNMYADDNNEDTQVDNSISESEAGINVSDGNLPECIAKLEVRDDSMNINENTNESEPTVDVNTSTDEVKSLTEKYNIFHGDNCVIVVLKHHTDLYIHGKVVVRKLAGHAQLYGYDLGDEPCNVYAPYYNFAHCLSTLQGENIHMGLFNKLTSKGVLISDAEDIVTKLGTYDVVLALEKLNNVKMDFLESNFNASNLFSRTIENVPLNFKRASEKLCCSLYPEQPYKHFQENPKWQEAVRFGLSSSDSSIGIVCGGKGSGKSTFLRYYVNQLVANGAVLIVDLDLGQCEFTIAGSISATIVTQPLLGPNFTHLKKPDIMLNIGMISPMDNVKRYLSAVEELITRCKENVVMSRIPWIVNTMGMCNAIGLKFITYTILRTFPTFLLQIELQNMKKNFPFHLTPQKVEELYKEYKNDRLFARLPTNDPMSYAYIVTGAETFRTKTNTGSDNSSLAPREERYLNLLAYFGELAHMHKTTSLLTITPYSVSLQDLYIATNIRIHKDTVKKVLNGKVLALCRQNDKTSKVFNLTDKALLCYGHGLVRGIDQDIMYVITPVPPNDLALVNTVVYADWMPELRGQEKTLPAGTVVPYRMLSVYQQRQLMSVPRRRFNPLQLLKMSGSGQM